MKPMEPYHLAWLKAHPERSEQWLQAHLSDGFDIHHLDGDHSNNSPGNLALIEHRDHMRLHGMRLRDSSRFHKARKRAVHLETGRRLYEARCSHMSWREACRLHFKEPDPKSNREVSMAIAKAKEYAKHAGQPWPIALTSKVSWPRR